MITVIFGKPGAGKTAYLTAVALKYLGSTLSARELLSESCRQISALNSSGMNYTLPDRPPVYSNYPISAPIGYKKRRNSYYIDGFHMGFQNEFVPVVSVFPGAKIFLTEVQRYYNSRVPPKEFPDWVSRFYEEHRHFGLDIYLDLQRLGLLDLNIRELCEQFIEVVEVKHKTDYAGNVLQSEFTLRIWSTLSAAEAFIGNSSLKNFDEVKETFCGNVFEAYKSRSYFEAFLPSGDFDGIEHIGAAESSDLTFVKTVYRQTAPYGFYKSEAAQILKERKKSNDAA